MNKALLFIAAIFFLLACNNKLHKFYTVKQSRRAMGWDNIVLNMKDSTYVHSTGLCSMGRIMYYGKWQKEGNKLILQSTFDVNNMPMHCDTLKDGKGVIIINAGNTFFGSKITVAFNNGKKFIADKEPVVMFKKVSGIPRIDSLKVTFIPQPGGVCCYRYSEFKTETIYPDTSTHSLLYSVDLTEVDSSLGFFSMDTATYKVTPFGLSSYYIDEKDRKHTVRYTRRAVKDKKPKKPRSI